MRLAASAAVRRSGPVWLVMMRRFASAVADQEPKTIGLELVTIRKRIRRQLLKTVVTLVVPAIVFSVLKDHLPNVPLGSPLAGALMLSPMILLVLELWAVVQITEIVCPKCRIWMGVVAVQAVIRGSVHCCPKCGVNFDSAVQPYPTYKR